MLVKLWNKEKRKYENIENVDSVYCNTFSNNIDLTCGVKKTSYDVKVYDLVTVHYEDEV